MGPRRTHAVGAAAGGLGSPAHQQEGQLETSRGQAGLLPSAAGMLGDILRAVAAAASCC
jgi:hypothetical protein